VELIEDKSSLEKDVIIHYQLTIIVSSMPDGHLPFVFPKGSKSVSLKTFATKLSHACIFAKVC